MRKPHLVEVDGIKGLAILAVFVTHIPLTIWYTFIPQFLRPLISIVLSSGGVGVTLFFLTSGFLMGYLYPAPRSAIAFYARRYSRLFPAFLVMVASFTVFNLVKLPVATHIVVVFASILFMRFLLQLFRILARLISLGNKPIYLALGLQIFIALWYVFYLQKVPASVFYINWNPVVQKLITGVINATLTLPFGKYIGQLDGIYWALGAEILFYLLYPVAIVPIIANVRSSSRPYKTLLYLAMFPFCYGLYEIGLRLLGFEMLHIHLVIYFITGVLIGQNLNLITHTLQRMQKLLTHPAWQLFLILVLLSSVFLTRYLSVYFETWLTLVMTIPAGLLLISALFQQKTFLARAWLTGLGKFSYAIFLTHSLVIQVVQKFIPADSAISGTLMVLFAFSGTLLLAYILRLLIERAYFISRKPAEFQNEGKIIPTQISLWRTTGFIACLFLVAYISFRPPLSFFTTVIRHVTSPETVNSEITLSDQPYRQTFKARENNFGMATTHIKKTHVPGIEGGFVPFLLTIRLWGEQEQMISESTYQAYQILDDPYLAFGFPVISDAKNKKYTVEYELSEMSPSEELKLVTDEADFLSVYFINKKLLFENPGLLISWIMQKGSEPFTNPKLWLTAAHILPLLGLLLGIGLFKGAVYAFSTLRQLLPVVNRR